MTQDQDLALALKSRIIRVERDHEFAKKRITLHYRLMMTAFAISILFALFGCADCPHGRRPEGSSEKWSCLNKTIRNMPPPDEVSAPYLPRRRYDEARSR